MTRTVLFFFLLGTTLLRAQETATPKPNIIFFITDDAFKRQMSWLPEGRDAEGNPLFHTPTLDRLAKSGTVFTHQYVASPVCTPSRFNCLTGLYASRSQTAQMKQATQRHEGIVPIGWNTYITDETPTLGKLLKAQGYRTAFVGKNHVIEAEDMEKPELHSDPRDPEVKALLERNYARQQAALNEAGFDYSASLYYNNPGRNGLRALEAHNLDWIARGALDFLKQDHEQPFFMWIASTVPHGPGDPKRSWKADRRITARGMLDEPLKLLSSPEDLQQRLQDSGIKRDWGQENMLWLDDLMAVLLQQLQASGELDNTVIVFFNDHGQLAKGTVYQGGVHGESFVWRSEPFPAGAVSETAVSNVDFAPTLLELAGGDPENHLFDGKSFLPLLEGKENKGPESLYFEMGFVRGVKKGKWKYIALRYPDWAANATPDERQKWLDRSNAVLKRRGIKIYNTDPMAPYSHVQLIPGGGDAERRSMGNYPHFSDADQLYNLEKDPEEQDNLAFDPEHRIILKELQAELQTHLANLPGTFPVEVK